MPWDMEESVLFHTGELPGVSGVIKEIEDVGVVRIKK